MTFNTTNLQRWFLDRTETLGVPGAAAALVSGNDTAVLIAGREHISEARDVTPDTRFQIASCSKAFTAVALGTLVDKGAFGFDDPVTRYLPEFTLDTEEDTAKATLRDLAGMRLGLQPIGASAWGRSRHVPHAEMFRRFQYLDRVTPMRESFIYSNLSYSAIAEVIARVSGMPFTAYMGRLLKEFGLASSFVEEGPMDAQPGIAVPHIRYQGRMVSLGGNRCGGREGESCQYSSAADFVPWLKFQLGQIEHPALSEQTFTALHTIQAPVPGPGPDGTNGYCMGWMRGLHHDAPIYAHEGGELGASAFALFLPESQIGVSVLINERSGARVRGLAYELADLLLGRETRDWMAEFAQGEDAQDAAMREVMAKEFVVTDKALPDLDALVGTYMCDHSGKLTVSREGAGLRLSFADMDVFNCTLMPLGGEIFNIESFDEIGVSMHLPGRIRIGGTGTDRFVEAATLGRFVISS